MQSLLVEIDRFLRRTNMPPTLFGRLSVNDPRLVSDMRRGRQVQPPNALRIRRFMADRI